MADGGELTRDLCHCHSCPRQLPSAILTHCHTEMEQTRNTVSDYVCSNQSRLCIYLLIESASPYTRQEHPSTQFWHGHVRAMFVERIQYLALVAKRILQSLATVTCFLMIRDSPPTLVYYWKRAPVLPRTLSRRNARLDWFLDKS